MIYELTTQPREIIFSPSSTIEEILQNVYTILTTMIFTVPLFREFALDASIIDDPIPIAKARLVSEVIEKVQMYENRVIVEEVIFNDDFMEGRIEPAVRIRLREGVIV
jgi:phage baseplate assembly protein W